jgi:ankyrin repeat protein
MAMHAAARGNEVEILQNLIVSGKHDINEKDSMKRTPLHMAAWAGHAEIVRVLLKSKAKTDVLANDNFTALHFASNVDVVKLLVKSNKSLLSARVSKGNKTALHIAVSKGNIDMVKCLIDLGSDVAAKTSSGQSCLDLAKTDEMSDVIKGFLQSKVDNQKAKKSDHTEDNSWQSNIPACTEPAETDEFTISAQTPSSRYCLLLFI